MNSISTANCNVSDICLYILSLMKSIVENKKITKCIVADIFHWDFSGGEGWDACLLLVIKQLGDVGILDSALEEGGFGQKHPPAIFLLACLPAPSSFSAHGLWVISPTQMLCIQSQFLHCLYTAALKGDLFAFGLICFLLQTVLVVLSFDARRC